MWVVKTMGNRAEELRKQTIAGGGATARHSMNQKTTGYIIGMQERGYDRKAEKAERRRWQQQQFLQELPGMQFNRALGHIVDGTASKEDIDYVERNIHGHEQTIETFRIRRSNGNGEERITGVTTTIVDFTRNPSKSLH